MKVVALLSGGMDSAVMAWSLKAGGDQVEAVSVDYGQRHQRELAAAREMAAMLGVPWSLVSVTVDLPGSALTDRTVAVPHGHYADESMRATVVPNRNMILLAVAAARAVAVGATAVAYAAHAGDHAIYPDCRPAFADAMRGALALCSYDPVDLVAPLLGMDKTGVARLGHSLGVPFYLTWTCYEGGAVHCGQCGSCTERREAFVMSGVADPTVYA